MDDGIHVRDGTNADDWQRAEPKRKRIFLSIQASAVSENAAEQAHECLRCENDYVYSWLLRLIWMKRMLPDAPGAAVKSSVLNDGGGLTSIWRAERQMWRRALGTSGISREARVQIRRTVQDNGHQYCPNPSFSVCGCSSTAEQH